MARQPSKRSKALQAVSSSCGLDGRASAAARASASMKTEATSVSEVPLDSTSSAMGFRSEGGH